MHAKCVYYVYKPIRLNVIFSLYVVYILGIIMQHSLVSHTDDNKFDKFFLFLVRKFSILETNVTYDKNEQLIRYTRYSNGL